MSEDLIVGTVGRAHGLRGQVTVRPCTDNIAERFATGTTLRGGDRTLTVAGHQHNSGRLVVWFDGVNDRAAAEELRGLDLWARGLPVQLDADEYPDSALIGCRAVDTTGTERGTVVGVEHHPAQDLLVIDTPTGKRLVPFVSALVPRVDLAESLVVIDAIPGLLSEVSDAD